MSYNVQNVVVEVLNKRFRLGELTIDDLPKELMRTDVGNIYDPVGQIASWLWENIAPLVHGAEEYLWGKLRTVRDKVKEWVDSVYNYLYQVIRPVINAINGVVSSIWSKVKDLPANLGSLLSSVSNTLLNLGVDITSISSFLNQLWQRIVNLPTTISSAIQSGFTTVSTWIKITISGIETVIGKISNAVLNLPSVIQTTFGSLYDTVSKIPKALSESLSSVGVTISNAFKSFSADIGKVSQGISGAFTQVYEFLSGIWKGLDEGLKGFREWLYEGFKGVSIAVTQLADGVETFFKDFPQNLQDFFAWIEGGWDQFTRDVNKWWKDSVAWWNEKVENISIATKEVQTTLMGFVNPLIDIKLKFDDFVKNITKFFENPLQILKDALSGVWNWFKEDVFPAVSSAFSSAYNVLADITGQIWGGVKSISQKVWDILSKGFTGLVDTATKGFKGIIDWMGKGLAGWLFTPYSMIPRKLFEDFENEFGKVQDITPEKLKSLQLMNQTKLLHNLGTYIFTSLGSPYLVSNFLRFLGKNMRGRIKGSPFGVGADIEIDVGSIFLHMSKMVWKIPDILLGSLAYGMGIWLYQPVAKLINSMARNQLPIELPSLKELLDISRRNMPFAEGAKAGKSIGGRSFDSFLVDIHRTMAWHGYNDKVVEWYITKKDVSYVDVLDRFNVSRKIPTSLLYEIPTASELARMMVRDIFGPALDPFPSFRKAIAMRGMVEDVAKMFYLLHFDYPPMEKLYRFACRCAVNMAWVSQKPLIEAKDLGAKGVSPADLNANVTNIASLKTHLNQWIKNYLGRYAKWHDYAQFSWIDNFTSDGLITMDMMADIPERIDARWMYKWQVPFGKEGEKFADEQLFRIVTARGMHPEFVESISIAEMMNAFAEERGYAKTGILNAFEQGFLTDGVAESKLSDMLKVKLLGKDVSIRFLEGEKKLLILRHTWDRAYNALTKLWGSLTLGFQRFQLNTQEVMEEVAQQVNNIKSCVGLDLEVDKKFLNCWLNTYSIRRKIETIQRIRYWMRIFIYRATQLAESGEEFSDLVNDFCDEAKLTDTERELMISLGTAFINVARKKRQVGIAQRIAKGKVRSGDWTVEQAKVYLVSQGMEKDDATSFLESEAKTRTVSIDKLIDMSEYIPIDDGILKQKMDSEGVPLNEQTLYRPYRIGRDISEEMGKIATELVNQFVYTTMSEADLRTKFNDLATLNGTVKSKLDIDWLCLSPEEREYNIQLAKFRRARRDEGVGVEKEKAKTLTSLHVIGATEFIPIQVEKLKDKFKEEGYPTDEQRILMDEQLAKEISEEVGKLATELVTDYANGMFTEPQLKAQLDNLATLGGSVPQLIGRAWIVLSPIERQLLINLAKLRKARQQKKG